MNNSLRLRKMSLAIIGALISASLFPTCVRAEDSDTAKHTNSIANLIEAQASLISARANYLRGLGEYMAKQAEALAKWQEVRSKKMDNDKKCVEVHFAKKQLRREYQKATRRPPINHERAVQLAKLKRPPRLREVMVPAGSIHPINTVDQRPLEWPSVLLEDRFTELRDQVDQLWAERLETRCGLGSWNCRALKAVSRNMQVLLRRQVRELTPGEYMFGMRFLRSLAYEAEFRPAGAADLVAAR